MKRLSLLLSCGFLFLFGFVATSNAQEPRPEVTLSLKEIGRLDIFEDRALSQADAAFELEDYAKAGEKYDAFLAKHKDSTATPYAMLRKGRSAELNSQLPDAIAAYGAVVTKYPKSVKYAAAALFYQGGCLARNGDSEKAATVRAALADNELFADSPFNAKPVAAATTTSGSTPTSPTTPSTSPTTPATPTTLTLAEYEKIALSGGDATDPAVAEAIGKVVTQHVRTAADEPKLRVFYQKTHKDAGAEPEKTLAYWLWVNDGIQANSTFTYYAKTERQTFFTHWLGLMKADMFPESDDFQIAIAKMNYGAERDRTKLAERLDAQFKKAGEGANPESDKFDWKRTLKWVAAYKGDYAKTREYVGMYSYETAGLEGMYALVDQLANKQNETYLVRSTFKKFVEALPFDKMSNKDVQSLIALAHGTVKDVTTAQTLAGNLDFETMTEPEKLTLARELLAIDGAIARPVYASLKDQLAAKLELFDHYMKTEDNSSAIVIAGELAEIKGQAAKYSLLKAEMLEVEKRYSDAITAYQACDSTPEILWKIVALHESLEQTDEAIQQLNAIAKAHRNLGGKASLKIASLYGAAEEKEKQIATLRGIIDRYPNSKEATEAQGVLGDLGVPPQLPTDTLFDF